MKIYERQHYGEKYVETGECRPPHESEMYLSPGYGPNKAHADFPSDAAYPILRLATPEEIAGTEKKMCPAGCGAIYGQHASHQGYQGCPWFVALLKKGDADSTADFPLCSAYADAHWREFVKYEVGVDQGNEPSKSVGVRLTPESVGKAYRTRGGWKAVVERPYIADGRKDCYVVRHVPKEVLLWHQPNGVRGSMRSLDEFNLISEWDEKAEAGVEAKSKPQAAEAVQPKRANDDNVAPAQPEILPTWADSDVLAEAVKIWGPTDVWKKDDVTHWRKRLAAWLNAPDDAPEDDDEPAKPDAPDRRAEHVPVAKVWVNPAMLGR